eukprot:2659304-Pleurochrysis_carterae.AAC.3
MREQDCGDRTNKGPSRTHYIFRETKTPAYLQRMRLLQALHLERIFRRFELLHFGVKRVDLARRLCRGGRRRRTRRLVGAARHRQLLRQTQVLRVSLVAARRGHAPGQWGKHAQAQRWAHSAREGSHQQVPDARPTRAAGREQRE